MEWLQNQPRRKNRIKQSYPDERRKPSHRSHGKKSTRTKLLTNLRFQGRNRRVEKTNRTKKSQCFQRNGQCHQINATGMERRTRRCQQTNRRIEQNHQTTQKNYYETNENRINRNRQPYDLGVRSIHKRNWTNQWTSCPGQKITLTEDR